MARQEQDYLAMANLVSVLMDIRQQRLKVALAVGKLTIIDKPFDETVKVTRGLLSGAAATGGFRCQAASTWRRWLRKSRFCALPRTADAHTDLFRSWRSARDRPCAQKVPPRKNEAKPDLDWLIEAMQELGDTSLELLDPTLPVTKRIEILIDDLDALPDHDGLYEASRPHAKKRRRISSAQSPKSGAKTKIKS